MPKKNRPADLTVEHDEPADDMYGMYKTPAPVLIVHVGDHLVDTTATSDESSAGNWIRSALKETRHLNRKRSGPLVVSLCAFKGLPDGVKWDLRGAKAHPNHPSNPYKVISICIAGCRVLFFRFESYYNEMPNIRPLRDLLGDKKVVVVGLGIKEIAKKLDSHWGIKIARPVDVRKVAANAYGKGAVYWPKRGKGTVVIDELSLEEMGELVLDGLVLEKKPSKILENDWGDNYSTYNDDIEEQRVMYASRDAFLCYEIGAKCIDMAGLPSDN
ncbi:hypothetical protein LUZ60_008607 [Juncus effusus]|nr:hypothetical protein LUZ60_008607 [Juncus effusus]